MSTIILCIVVICVSIIVKYLFNIFNRHRKLSTFKCAPNGKFLLGHLLDFDSNTSIIPSLMKCNEYDRNIKVDLAFFFPFLIISEPKLLEHILSSSKLIEKSGDYKHFEKWLGTGLLTSSAQKWFRMRKIITPTFHFQILEQFVDVFEGASNILIKKLERNIGNKFDISPYISNYTLDVICETSMGTTVNTQIETNSDYVKAIETVTKLVAQRGFEFLKQWDIMYFFSQDYWTERAAIKIIHNYTNNVIQKHKELIANKNVINTGKKKRLAFLDMLLQSTIDGKPLTDNEIRDEVNTFMFAGHDTTTTAISFILYCLSNNQNIQEKVVDELHNIFDDDKFRPIMFKDIQKMKYLEMVIKETLRLYPPASIFARELLEDEHFDEHILPSGVPLIIFPYGLHRNPKVFPEPEKFDPERFTTVNQAARSPYSYIPFSAGPRNCIGQKFAMLEMKTTIAYLIRKFIILPVPEHKIVLSFDTVTKASTGVFIEVQERNF